MSTLAPRGLCLAIMMLLPVLCLGSADLFPLAPGYQWTYQDAATGSTFTVDIAMNQIYVNNHVYHVLRGYTPKPVWVRINEYGNVVFWDEEKQSDVMLTAFETGFGGWFEAGARMCPQQGQAQEKRRFHDGPAGRWNVLEILYRTTGCADAGDLSEQFTENIGMVRRVVTTIAGPRTYDLAHARLGAVTISAGNHGGFSVTAAQSPDPSHWDATLRVEQRSGNGLRVRFPSSQEYDLRLRDSKGTAVWTWSADKAFLPAVHELDLGGGWNATAKVPIPRHGLPERQIYVLEAWLTAAEGEPHFAAATTVEAPGATPASARNYRRVELIPPGQDRK